MWYPSQQEVVIHFETKEKSGRLTKNPSVPEFMVADTTLDIYNTEVVLWVMCVCVSVGVRVCVC